MIGKIVAQGSKRVTMAGIGIGVSGIAVLGGIGLISNSVFAGLTATATSTAQSVTSQTLKLTQKPSGTTAGFTSAVSNMAPDDVVYRYVDLQNEGTMDGTAVAHDITIQVRDGAELSKLVESVN